MSSPRIDYTPRPDTTPEAELNALATVYKFILGCHACHKKKEVASSGDPDEAKGSHNDRPTSSIP